MRNAFCVRNSTIRHLVHPLRTVLDDSIGCALWFASRGRGLLYPSMQPYQSNARVIIICLTLCVHVYPVTVFKLVY